MLAILNKFYTFAVILKFNNMALKKELRLENRKEEFLYYYNQKLSDREIGEKLGVFRKTVGVYRKSLGLSPNKKSPLKLIEAKVLDLYNLGYSDSQIATQLGFSRGGILDFRTRRSLPRNKPISKNDLVIIKELKKLNYNQETIMRLIKQDININTEVIPNNKELAILIGILLGDGNIYKVNKRNKNACFTTSHSPSQRLYSIHIATVLIRLGARLHYIHCKTPDSRNNKLYESYIVRLTPSNFFTELQKIFYKDGIKIIPDYIYNYFTVESLAYQYMDDGSKMCGTYKIATNCFSIPDLQKFQYFLLTKFNLKTTIHSDHGIYIRKESAERFKALISPYIIDSMKYKLY